MGRHWIILSRFNQIWISGRSPDNSVEEGQKGKEVEARRQVSQRATAIVQRDCECQTHLVAVVMVTKTQIHEDSIRQTQEDLETN